MPTFELEYGLCQIQQGKFSMAAKSHRREGGNPLLQVDVLPTSVQWRVLNLTDGVPETVVGVPRENRIDFYFLQKDLKPLLAAFPPAAAAPSAALRLPVTDSTDTQRPGGKPIQPLYPIARFGPLGRVHIYNARPPAFEATAFDVELHLDFEEAPKSRYGSMVFEVHFGVRTSYEIAELATIRPSEAVLIMDHDFYATVLDEMVKKI